MTRLVAVHLARRLCLVLLLIICMALGAAIWAGHALTRDARGATGLPPPGLAATQVVLTSQAGTKLSAWYVEGMPGAGAVLLLHRVRSNKRSMLGRAEFLNRTGFSVLLIDLQAHGESEGERITFGLREADAVAAGAKELALLAPGERIGALGISLGAAAIVLSDVKADFSAVVLESLYPTIEEAVENRLRMRFGDAGAWLAPLLTMQLRPWLGIAAEQLRPIDAMANLDTAVLLVHGTDDKHTTVAQAERLFAAAEAPKEFYLVAGGDHGDLHAFSAAAYEQRIGEFLRQRLRADDLK